jgi:hypothetical protein
MRSLTSRCCERSHFRLDLLYSADVHRITEVVPSVWSGACPFSRNPTSCVVLRSGYRSRYTYGGARALTASRPCHVLSFKRLVITSPKAIANAGVLASRLARFFSLLRSVLSGQRNNRHVQMQNVNIFVVNSESLVRAGGLICLAGAAGPLVVGWMPTRFELNCVI